MRDDGSVLLLTLGLAVVLVLVTAVVASASQTFVARRALVAVADAAALRAAQEVDLDRLYRPDEDRDRVLPLDRAAARAAAADHVARSSAARFERLEVVAVDVDGARVTVRLRARVRTPLAAALGASAVVLEAASTARVRRGSVP